METLQPLVAPALAIVGPPLVGLIGLYLWRRQLTAPRRRAAAEASRKAHEELWQCLEGVNRELCEYEQTDGMGPSTDEALERVNTVVLKSSPYLGVRVQADVDRYVRALTHLKAVIGAWEHKGIRRTFDATAVCADSYTPASYHPGSTYPSVAHEDVEGGAPQDALTLPDVLRSAKSEVRRLRALVKTKLLRGAGVRSFDA